MRTAAMLLAMLVPVTGAIAADPVTMTENELIAYVTGGTYTGVNPETGSPVGTVTYNGDGTSVLIMADGREEAGSYRFVDDLYCTRYAAFRDNAENCFRLEALGDGRAQAWYADGSKALILIPES